jgi:hypothetical protein
MIVELNVIVQVQHINSNKYNNSFKSRVQTFILFVMFFMFLFFYVLYDFDMFHIPLSCDNLRDLWNEYICMYRILQCKGHEILIPHVKRNDGLYLMTYYKFLCIL